jgi:hypothetical protein
MWTYEIDTDRGDVRLSVCVIGETEQQTRLSNTGVTDEEELEEVVVPRRASVPGRGGIAVAGTGSLGKALSSIASVHGGNSGTKS